MTQTLSKQQAELVTLSNVQPHAGSLLACYIGCVFSVALRHAKISSKEFQDMLRMACSPSLNGERIPTPRQMKTRGVGEKLFELSPEIMGRKGLGDVLMAYQNTGKVDADLMDPALVQMVQETATIRNLTPRAITAARAQRLKEMFNLSKTLRSSKGMGDVRLDEDEDLIPLSPDLLRETYAPAEMPLAILAQEAALRDKNKPRLWKDMALARKKILIEEKYRALKTLPSDELQRTFTLFARHLMDRLDPANPSTTVQDLSAALEKAGINGAMPHPPADPVHRRALYLVRHPVGR